jgi:hypothetical protein
MDWIHLAQDRDHCWTVVSTVMNIHIPKKVGYFLSSRVTIRFSERILCCMELVIYKRPSRIVVLCILGVRFLVKEFRILRGTAYV